MRVLSTNDQAPSLFTVVRPTCDLANANLTGWKITADETQSAKSIEGVGYRHD